MSFTDRFITVPIRTVDKEREDLTGEKIITSTFMKLNPFEIASYRPCTDDGEDCVRVTCKDGEGFYVYKCLHDFELLLNNHTKNA